MYYSMCVAKLHRVTVTDAKLDYPGSITIDQKLMKAAGIHPYELVHINSMANAAHWETYVISGKDGQICLNGCPARLFMPGDQVIILAIRQLSTQDLKAELHRTVTVDAGNHVTDILEIPLEAAYEAS